jgi:tRNA-uridine 2-sulfurtransferase
MTKKIKIIVGISGGVDSAVALLLLKNQGHDVSAVFMQNWQAEKNDAFCTADQDLIDAKSVCEKLRVPLHTVNFTKEYWNKVFQYFLDEYSKGHTPNPDVMCNKEIKFKAFLEYAESLGADYIATGHYARIQKGNSLFHLLKGLDENKDQSYFLYTLSQNQLKRSLFPIGHLKKTEVRKIAAENGLSNYAKKDSTGICFIGERNFKKFLSEYLLAKPGDIVDTEGKIMGKHDGIMFYTLGQRKGLGIGGQKNTLEAPWYVVAKDIKNNQVIVSQDHNHSLLLTKALTCDEIHWILGNEPSFPLSCTAKIRYRQKDQECVVNKIAPQKYEITFKEAQWAATPGQSLVFYQDDECLGGGTIKH